MQTTQITIDNLCIDVVFKDIKTIRLSVVAPDGAVRISAPINTKLEKLRLFSISKLGWIRKKQELFINRPKQAQEYIDREICFLWGQGYQLEVQKCEDNDRVEKTDDRIVIHTTNPQDQQSQLQLMSAWYRQQIGEILPDLISKWEKIMGIKIKELHLRPMKTRWGSCSHHQKTIRLNTELAKKPICCLEYILVHEMTHFFVPNHGDRFVALMDKFLPSWRVFDAQLEQRYPH